MSGWQIILGAVAALLCAMAAGPGCSKAPEPPVAATNAPPAPTAVPPSRWVTNQQAALAQRRAALLAMSAEREGARQLAQWAAEGVLSNDLRLAASLELAHAPWPEVRTQALEVLPPLRDAGQQLLPRLAELLARPGNAARGAQVFRRPEVNCIGCHRVDGEGVALGSDLSDIGLRMSREELVENLLDPSAVITPGYETWLLILDNDDEYVGLLARETADILALRDAKNNELPVKKSALRVRRQVPVSLMPSGLEQTMTTAELVDLLAYLGSLRRTPEPPAATNATRNPF